MFKDSDFDIFTDMTLDGRMAKIQSIIDPSFIEFSEKALPILCKDGQQWFSHVALHRMRTLNPPDNTWVAFSTSKRGYKMMPHFELGIWDDHIYFYLAVEENMKPQQLSNIAPKLTTIAPDVKNLPSEFVISTNHMMNKTTDLSHYVQCVEKFKTTKRGEVLIGMTIKRGDPRIGTSQVSSDFLKALTELMPLYEKLK